MVVANLKSNTVVSPQTLFLQGFLFTHLGPSLALALGFFSCAIGNRQLKTFRGKFSMAINTGLELKWGKQISNRRHKYALNNYLVFAFYCLSLNKNSLHSPPAAAAAGSWKLFYTHTYLCIFIFYHWYSIMVIAVCPLIGNAAKRHAQIKLYYF